MLSRRPDAVPQIGFTLVELIIVLVVVGILSVIAAMRSVSTADVTLPSQAQKLASDIRHTQTLATTWGRSLRLSVSGCPGNDTYCVSCVTFTAGVPPCNVSPVIDPATGSSFSVALQKDVVLTGTPTPQLDFNSLGQPTQPAAPAGASYTLGSAVTVTVAALTGFVKVCPPDTCP